ncbi:MAG: hypothetical protein QM533_04990 [Cytophagales bacterium]|nr:hypothetical protein [Cytophagales bacterium]
MTVTAQEFIDSAEVINQNGVTEIAARNAVSRAYYGAYHACEKWHSQLSIPGYVGTGDFGQHEALIRRLTNPFQDSVHPNCTNASIISKRKGCALRMLRNERVRADYQLDCLVDREHAARAIEQAKLIVTL